VEDLPQRALAMATTIADAVSGQDLDATLLSLTRAAVETLPGVDESTVTLRKQDGSLHSYASTADYLEELDQWQFENSEGPCYDGVTENAVTVCGDLRHDPRYPIYGPRAAAAGIRSQAGIRLFESPRAVGGLNLYSRTLGTLSDVGFLAELFAEHARSAVAYASEIEGLREAVTSRQVIGQAVGIVMERYDLRGDRAFALLSRLSSTRNVKLRRLAEEIVEDRGSEGPAQD
jgi:GAF domain-containing protein